MTSMEREYIPSRDEVTVLVHGIWMQGPLMQVMGRMLKAQGIRTEAISYDFLSSSPSENARHLYDEIGLIGAKKINLVGHSLGGIVILHLLNQFPDLPIDKIVLIGSPVKGSSVARKVHEVPLLRPLLGRSVEKGLLGGVPAFTANLPLGIITGEGRLGLSALFYPTGSESDGVVLESETLIENATDRVSLPASHSTIIFSRKCAEYVAQFLATGRFRP